MKKTTKIYKRAIRVNHNYGPVKKVVVLRGEKAGRFATTGKSTKRRAKNAVDRDRTRNRGKNIGVVDVIKAIFSKKFFKIVCWIILISWICSHIRVGKPENTEASSDNQIEINMTTTSFQSAEIPAGYIEPDLFDKYFESDAKIARAICQAESGMQDIRSHYQNKNGTYDWGRCQINEIHAGRVGGDITKVLDPDLNVKIAHDIYSDRKAYDGIGWTAWTKYNNGDYKQFLN